MVVLDTTDREWLEADGLGGFASGTVEGLRTRRYHGLLLPATHPPTGRVMLVNGVEALVECAGERFALSTQCYGPDVIHPDGHTRVIDFQPEPWPTWRFRVGEAEITQECLAHHGTSETLLRWKAVRRGAAMQLFVRPLLSGRDYHALHRENPAFRFDAEVSGHCVTWRPYAAWDLAFHCIPLALIDSEFAKSQLVLLTREWYMHPNGQLPAYEWAFGDVNPPVHAWATWRVFQIDRKQRGDSGDLAFLGRVFHKLMLNFTWWANRKDGEGRNIFQGGFLGLDNIGVFDRSAPLPTGGFINQADGTSWMAMYSLNLMRIALELAQHNRVYEDIATKFFEHFLHIAAAMNNIGNSGIGLWDEQDQFFYDVLNLPDGRMVPLKVRSMVGLIPLFAVETIEPELLERLPEFKKRLEWFLNYRPDLAGLVSRWNEPGRGDRRLLSLLRGHRMKRVLRRMLDESEFLSPYGVRAISRGHRDEPYVFRCNGASMTVRYEPGESSSGLFGGNSNWRGPIWFPVNYLIIESLQKFHHYYGDDFKVECPTGSGRFVTILGAADELSRRLASLFAQDPQGRRPVFGEVAKLQTDPNFRDYLLFHEYFHGDSGRGVGASHQTGWTGLIAKLLMPRQADRLVACEQTRPPAARSADVADVTHPQGSDTQAQSREGVSAAAGSRYWRRPSSSSS